jgi:hypothetical protein
MTDTRLEVLREVYRITERRNGAVYRTQRVGFEWVPMDSPAGRLATVGDTQYCSPPTDYPGQTIRRVQTTLGD